MHDDELFNELFESVLNKAIEKFDEQPDKSLPEVKSVEFSEQHKKKIKKILIKEKRKYNIKNFCKYSCRIAACFFVFLIVSGVTIMNVDALRVRVLNLIFNTNETNTDIQFSDNADFSIENNDYGLEYVPEGFTLEEQNITDDMIRLKFSNSEEYFTVLTYNINGKASVDTENANCEIIIINGQEAFFNKNINGKMLSMQYGNQMIIINGTIDREEIVKIAQNMKKDY